MSSPATHWMFSYHSVWTLRNLVYKRPRRSAVSETLKPGTNSHAVVKGIEIPMFDVNINWGSWFISAWMYTFCCCCHIIDRFDSLHKCTGIQVLLLKWTVSVHWYTKSTARQTWGLCVWIYPYLWFATWWPGVLHLLWKRLAWKHVLGKIQTQHYTGSMQKWG